MKGIWNWIQLAFAAVGGWLGWALGGLDGFLYALIAFVVIDYITGVMCAVVYKKLSSEVGAQGIFKKILIFAMVAVGNIIDAQILAGGAVGGSTIRTAVVFFYLANEGLSIVENATLLGLPVPDKLRNVLAQLHNGKSIHKAEEPAEPGKPVIKQTEETDHENLS